ncbi:hypothetical protein DSO57_1015839 [Entomophthora muscae]|uniref:Uncharacterized protein n=1 Tax=Entomophthora muscae TaxID=34485 RepID=A0ACC2TFM9_9FUNG|nr:hypothetical protein DSO57_1015839 [Entomophthora muscae]
MLAHLGLFAPVLEKLASVMIKVAIDFMSTPWPALYTLTPLDSSSNFPLQIILTATILLSTFCYTNVGSKMLKLSSIIGILLLKQLTICILYPHCLSLNHAVYHFTLTPEPFALPAILAPFKDAFDANLSCALPPHSCHNLTFKTMVGLVKIDAPMYPLSELEDKALGA